MRDQFDRLWPLLQSAVNRYGPTHTKEHVWQRIASGQADFWPGQRSAIVTEILVWPTGFKELRGWLAAGDKHEIRDMEAQIAAWAKAQGCKRAVLLARKGWLRFFTGYRERMIVLTKEL